MNIVVINASPRKRANTARLCKSVVNGAEDRGVMLNILISTVMILKDV